MKILSNSLRIEFSSNPGEILQIIANGWATREGLLSFWQGINEPGQILFRIKDVRHSAEALRLSLSNLNELLGCVRGATNARLLGELVFASNTEVWRVTASEWAHGRFVVEWDRIEGADEEDEGGYEHET